MTELTDTERETLRGLCWIDSAVDPPEWAGFLNDVLPAVEAILTARLARVEALAERGQPDGWVWKRDLRAALAAPTPTEVQP